MKIVCIAGARPNFMKVAPLLHAMVEYSDLEATLVHTGQHYDRSMSQVFFDELEIPEPDVNLGIGGGTRDEQISGIMKKFAPFLSEARPDAVLVVGDVNSTVACTRIAREQGVATIHVEAGLRSFDNKMPEEVNRIETDQLSDFLFVTERSGMDNLKHEAIKGEAFLVGNVMIDTLVKQLKKVKPEKILDDFGLTLGDFMVGTFHRPSNVDGRASLANVIEIIEYIAQSTTMLLPLHPRTRNSLIQNNWLSRLENNPNVRLCPPMAYLDFISAVSLARGIITDSGGVQEETTYLQVPCITMRDNTERPVTVEVGSNVLAGTNPHEVKVVVRSLLEGRLDRGQRPELWDGFAAQRIITILRDRFPRS